jgi:GTP cyclohydrolase I
MEGSESYSICPSLENGVGGAQGTSGDGERARKQSVVVMSSTTERGQVDDEARCHRISGAVKVILQELGIDLARCNLQDTPERYARALLEFTSGYAQSAEEILSGAVFPETYSDMIVERDIDIWSLCEHHMVPFFGKCHIAYIPQGRILGLSKLARVAEMYARRLQVQERLTRQIADCIEEYLHPRGVAVYIEATHLCMSMRGIRKTDARTTTITTRGVFAEDRSLQEQFLDLVNR